MHAAMVRICWPNSMGRLGFCSFGPTSTLGPATRTTAASLRGESIVARRWPSIMQLLGHSFSGSNKYIRLNLIGSAMQFFPVKSLHKNSEHSKP